MNDTANGFPSISSLADEDKATIARHWKEALGCDMPANLRLALAVPMLAYRMQEKRFEKLPAKIDRRLKALLEVKTSKTGRPVLRVQPLRPQLKHGTRLLRAWQGTTYQVTVTDAGFESPGKIYPPFR